MRSHRSRSEVVPILLGVVVVAAAFVAFAIGQGLGPAALMAGLLIAFMALVYAGRRRSGTLDVMSGIGDERSRALSTRAVAVSGTIMSFVLPGWWLVTVAQGDPDPAPTALCAIFGFTFVGAVIVLSRRG